MSNNLINTGVVWLPQLPNDWRIQKVKHCFKISKEPANDKNPVVLSLARAGIKVRDISNNEGQLAASYENYNVVQPGDLLLNPMDLYSGANCNVSEVSGVISPAYSNLRNYIDLNPKFFDYYFKTQYWTMAMFAHGKGVSFDNRWTLNNESLLNYEVPFPCLDIQNEIVEALNIKCHQIDSLIINQEKQIEKLKEHKIALISEIVCSGLRKSDFKSASISWVKQIPNGWEVKTLKSIFNFGKGLPITKDNLTEEGIKVISYGQIHAKYNKAVKIDDRLFRYVSASYLKSNPDCLVQQYDFIVADTSEDVPGTGDFIHIDRDDQIFAGYHDIILKNKNRIYSYYLAYLFMSDPYRSQYRCRVGGVKLFSLTKKILGQGTVILPPLDEQKEIVEYLDKKCNAIDRLIEIKQEKTEKLNIYKKSLIYEYVTGKKEVAW